MRVVLDTGAFYRRGTLGAFRGTDTEVVVPGVAFAERLRQLARDGRDIHHFLATLEEASFFVEAFGETEALRMVPLDDATWALDARDAMIAAHVREGDVLWTTNPRDFLALGLKQAQVRGI